MATTDRRGATVSAADPPIGTNPNPDLAIKAPVRVATPGSNITLSGLQTIDGVALAANDRVLVKDQTDATTNGLYNASTGPWTRTIDANNNSQFTQGLTVGVATGTTNASATFKLTSANPITLGTTALTWSAITIPSIIAGLTINPPTGTFNRGFTISQNPAGSAAATQSYNLLQIGDTATITGLNFGIGLNIFHAFGGSTVQGGREALQAEVSLTATTNPSTSNQNYVGVQGIGSAQVNDNGLGLTTGNSRGAVFGGAFFGLLAAGATDFFNVTGCEFNSGVQTGASVCFKSLIQLSADATDRVQGAVVDSMFWAYNQSVSSPGWNTGILFDNTGGIGAWPIKSTGTIFKTGGSGTAAHGIDLSNTTFSSDAFKSTGFSIDGAGNLVALGGTISAVGISTPVVNSTWLAIAAGTTAIAQINFAASTAPTSPNNGDWWFDGTNLNVRISGSTKTITHS